MHQTRHFETFLFMMIAADTNTVELTGYAFLNGKKLCNRTPRISHLHSTIILPNGDVNLNALICITHFGNLYQNNTIYGWSHLKVMSYL